MQLLRGAHWHGLSMTWPLMQGAPRLVLGDTEPRHRVSPHPLSLECVGEHDFDHKTVLEIEQRCVGLVVMIRVRFLIGMPPTLLFRPTAI